MYLISSEKVNHGLCLIDIYRAPGDLYSSWDIIYWNNGNPSRVPDASYGPDARDRVIDAGRPVKVLEVIEKWDRNGHIITETTIYVDGKIVASRKN